METHGGENKSPYQVNRFARHPPSPRASPPLSRSGQRGNRWGASEPEQQKRDAAGTMLSSFSCFILGGGNAAWNASREARRAKTARARPPPARMLFVSGPRKEVIGKRQRPSSGAAAKQQHRRTAALGGFAAQIRPSCRLSEEGAEDADQRRASPTKAPPPVPQEPAATTGPCALSTLLWLLRWRAACLKAAPSLLPGSKPEQLTNGTSTHIVCAQVLRQRINTTSPPEDGPPSLQKGNLRFQARSLSATGFMRNVQRAVQASTGLEVYEERANRSVADVRSRATIRL